MSNTTILAIWFGDKIVEAIPKLSNSWGSAPLVWEALYIKYICNDDNDGSGLWMRPKEFDKLWALYKDTSIPLAYRAVLMMTFDKVYILKGDYARAADDIDVFTKDFPTPDNRINHWGDISLMFRNNNSIPAIGFWHTSVSENPYIKGYNDETNEYEYNWDEMFNLYEELDNYV